MLGAVAPSRHEFKTLCLGQHLKLPLRKYLTCLDPKDIPSRANEPVPKAIVVVRIKRPNPVWRKRTLIFTDSCDWIMQDGHYPRKQLHRISRRRGRLARLKHPDKELSNVLTHIEPLAPRSRCLRCHGRHFLLQSKKPFSVAPANGGKARVLASGRQRRHESSDLDRSITLL